MAEELGFRIPHTIVTNSPEEARNFYHGHDRIVYKTLRQGRILTGENANLVYTSPINQDHAESFGDVAYAPSLLQEYVPKKVELRVTVIGPRVFAVEIYSQERSDSEHDWRRGNPLQLRHRPVSLRLDLKPIVSPSSEPWGFPSAQLTSFKRPTMSMFSSK